MSKLGFVRIPKGSKLNNIEVDVEKYLNLNQVYNIELCCDDLFNKGQILNYIVLQMERNNIYCIVFVGENETIKTWLQGNTI